MPDLEEDEETDERAPLVAARPEPAPPAWREIRAMLWLLRWVLLLAVLNTCLMRTASVAYFPYLRTLQYCDTPANPAATHTSDWSGSDHCGDLKLVTREAQAIVGLGRGVGLVAHCVSMPFLGRLGDTVGRRILLIIHFVGMLLESMINAANPSVPVFVLGCALRGALSSLWPALMSMIADLCRPEQRILAYGLVALATAVVGTVCFVAVTKHVLERHHSDYRPFWGVLTVFSLCGCLLACACPETLPPGPATAAEGKESRVTRRSRLCMCARLFASCHALPGRADAGLGVTACGTVLANPLTLFTHCTRTAHALHTHCTRTHTHPYHAIHSLARCSPTP
jgi:MFS family permease